MITLKLKEIEASIDALTEICKYNLSSALAYKLCKVLKKCVNEIKIYHEIRNAKVKQYGTCIEGDRYNVSMDNLAIFNEEINQLTDIDVELPWEPIASVELLKQLPNIKPFVLSECLWLFSD